MAKYKDLIGQKFGKLTVIEYIGKSYWLCKCECGNVKKIRADALKQNKTKSCGCLNKINNYRLYQIYYGIKQRCYNIKRNRYKNYGGRGIIMCEEWKNDFKTFYNWSLNNGYNDTLTIDRIDVNGNYEPNNCRWVDMKIQNNNRCNNHLITYNNETLTMKQWAEKLNINYQSLSTALNRNKKDFEYVIEECKKINKNLI